MNRHLASMLLACKRLQIVLLTSALVIVTSEWSSTSAEERAGDGQAKAVESTQFGVVIAPRPKIDVRATDERTADRSGESDGRTKKGQELKAAVDAAAGSPPFGIVIAPRRKLPKQELPTSPPQTKTGESEPATDDSLSLRAEPAESQPEQQPAEPAADDLPVIVPQPARKPRYIEIYNSIPFSRAEFNANPSYRHEATMEILTGNPRPAKINLTSPAPAPSRGLLPNLYELPFWYPYFDYSRGPYSRYQHLFGYEGGYRPLFYRY